VLWESFEALGFRIEEEKKEQPEGRTYAVLQGSQSTLSNGWTLGARWFGFRCANKYRVRVGAATLMQVLKVIW
jgi:hypothetical protein